MNLTFVLFVMFSVTSLTRQTTVDRNLETEIQDFLNEIQINKMTYHTSKKSVRKPTSFQEVLGFATVETTSGNVTGSTLPECHSFYSIPYGEAPVGNLRFQPPVAVENRGALNVSMPNYIGCFEYPLNCTSDENCEENLSEDCLVLNINVPATMDLTSQPTELLPVMFWIHGGSFDSGSGTSASYDGRWLSNATNTIIVSVNYRVDAFGFLVYEQDGVKFEGNQGLKDQQLALRWVQDNIENFGGDKDKVTIFGNSAGAQSVMFHLMSPTSDPLFRRAIMQSNPAVFVYPTQQEAMDTVTTALLNALKCSNGNGLKCLREASAVSLIQAHGQVLASNPPNLFFLLEPYHPVLDGVEIKEEPLDFFQSGKWQKSKEVILGTTFEESTFINAVFANRTMRKSLFEALTNFAVGPELGALVAEKYVELAVDGQPDSNYDYTDILQQASSDLFFVCPSRALARFMSATTSQQPPRIFLYVDYHPLTGDACEIEPELCGYAYHGSETIFLFNAGPNTGVVFSEDDTYVANLFSKFWGHFAHYGTPSDDVTEWPHYVPNTLDGGNVESWSNVRLQAPMSGIEGSFRQSFCDFWDSTGFYVNITMPNNPSPLPTTMTTTTTTKDITDEAVITTTTDSGRVLSFNKTVTFSLSILLVISISFC